jgi:hypothetical protein
MNNPLRISCITKCPTRSDYHKALVNGFHGVEFIQINPTSLYHHTEIKHIDRNILIYNKGREGISVVEILMIYDSQRRHYSFNTTDLITILASFFHHYEKGMVYGNYPEIERNDYTERYFLEAEEFVLTEVI